MRQRGREWAHFNSVLKKPRHYGHIFFQNISIWRGCYLFIQWCVLCYSWAYSTLLTPRWTLRTLSTQKNRLILSFFLFYNMQNLLLLYYLVAAGLSVVFYRIQHFVCFLWALQHVASFWTLEDCKGHSLDIFFGYVFLAFI